MFSVTTNLRRAVAILNDLDATKSAALLSRIFQNVHNQNEKTFTDEELTKLQAAFSLNSEDLEIAVESCEFIFLQAAYHAAKPAVLSEELKILGLNEDKTSAMVDLWIGGGRELVANLRQLSVVPRRLNGISWQLDLEMSESSQANIKQPTSLWELRISDNAASAPADERLQLEFRHEQLYDFYNQLEMIQSQIDELG